MQIMRNIAKIAKKNIEKGGRKRCRTSPNEKKADKIGE